MKKILGMCSVAALVLSLGACGHMDAMTGGSTMKHATAQNLGISSTEIASVVPTTMAQGVSTFAWTATLTNGSRYHCEATDMLKNPHCTRL